MPSNGAFHEESSALPSAALVAMPPAIDALAIQRAPDVVLAEATKAAKALHDVIEAKPRKVVFNGKTYLQFEDWQTLGRFYGVTAVGRATKYVEFGEGDYAVRGFEATADALLVGTGQVISSAEALCLDDEANWGRKPLFQLKSMAQTRAAAKALRNVLAWIVVLAGYAPTPAEEMESESGTVAAPRRKTVVKSGSSDSHPTISFTQQKELFDIGDEKGWTRPQVMAFLAKHGYEQPNEITVAAFAKLRDELQED